MDGLEIVQKVVVLRRLQPPIELGGAHEVDFQDLIRKQSAHCPPEVMEAEDPLYILYTSGTTGKNVERILRFHRSEEHTSELQSHLNLVCRLLLEKKKSKST